MDNQNKKTAIQDEQQLNELDNTKTLLNIESHLKSIANSLDKICKYGIATYTSNWSYPTN